MKNYNFFQSKFIYFLILLTIWILLVGIPIKLVDVIFAIILPLIIVMMMKKIGILHFKNELNLRSFFYLFWLLKEIILSSISVIKIVLSPHIFIRPSIGIVNSKELGNTGSIIYANSITLTPGTLSLKLCDGAILVHALDVSMLEDLNEGKMHRQIKNILI